LKIIFAGTPQFSVPALEVLLNSKHEVCAVYTQPDRPAGRGQKLTASPIKQLAEKFNIPIFQPSSLRSLEEQQRIAALNADIMIVVAYGLILPEAVLKLPRLGCVNIHASLLPRWRGAAPIQRAILAGDTSSGISYMQMDIGLDTGNILQQIPCPIEGDDTAQTLHDRLSYLGAENLLGVLMQLETNKLVAIPQDEHLVTYAAKLEKSEACLDWTFDAQHLAHQVRGFNPWPVAYTHWEAEVLRIWQAEVIPGSTSLLAPGTLIQATKEGLDVATGKACLRLLKIQLPGGKPLPVKDFLNARQNALIPGVTCFK
jgi:methionyl-tRNA formyltransferase